MPPRKKDPTKVKTIDIKAPTKQPDRITVVQTLNHEHPGQQPLSIPLRYNCFLEGDEQHWNRRIVVRKEWMSIAKDCWIPLDKVSYVVIENLEGRVLTVHPTKEEADDITSRILEVSYTRDSKQCELIYSKDTRIFRPADATEMSIRCQADRADVVITVICR